MCKDFFLSNSDTGGYFGGCEAGGFGLVLRLLLLLKIRRKRGSSSECSAVGASELLRRWVPKVGRVGLAHGGDVTGRPGMRVADSSLGSGS